MDRNNRADTKYKQYSSSQLKENLCNVHLQVCIKDHSFIHYSDRGSQYCSYEYQDLLGQFNMKASMSGKGNCYDKAPMESFWGTLKQELVHHRHYRTRKEAIQDIIEYIEVFFYNRQRRQARLGFLSPAVYAQKYYAGACSMKGIVSTIDIRPQL